MPREAPLRNQMRRHLATMPNAVILHWVFFTEFSSLKTPSLAFLGNLRASDRPAQSYKSKPRNHGLIDARRWRIHIMLSHFAQCALFLRFIIGLLGKQLRNFSEVLGIHHHHPLAYWNKRHRPTQIRSLCEFGPPLLGLHGTLEAERRPLQVQSANRQHREGSENVFYCFSVCTRFALHKSILLSVLKNDSADTHAGWFN